MRRFSLAASGLGFSVLVSIAVADNEAPSARSRVDELPTVTTTAAEVTAPQQDAVPREEFLRLLQEKQSLETALTRTQHELQELKAAKLLGEATHILTRIASECPQTGAAQDASYVLRHLNAAALQRGIAPAARSSSASAAPRLFVDAQQRAFIDFGQVVVNLNEGRLNRYLQVDLALQVPDEHIEQVSASVAANKAVLKNWLMSHLSDQSTEDVRGSESQNRLRDEIKNGFNTALFPEGEGQIELVLFQQFVVQ